MNTGLEIDHSKAIESVPSYLNGILSTSDQELIQRHFSNCHECKKAVDDELGKIDMLRFYIPFEVATDDEIKGMNNEISSIWPLVYKKQKIDRDGLFKKSIKKIIGIEKELTQIIFSKDMVKFYLMSLILAGIVKSFI